MQAPIRCSRSRPERRGHRRWFEPLVCLTACAALILPLSPSTWASTGPECCSGTIRGQVVDSDSERLSKQPSGLALAPGDSTQFMVTYAPSGPGGWVEDTLPAELTVVGAVQCSTGRCSYDASRNAIRWDGDAAGPVTINYQAMVRSDVTSDRVVTHHAHGSDGIVAQPTTRIVVCKPGEVLERSSGQCKRQDQQPDSRIADDPNGGTSSSAMSSGLKQGLFWTSGALLALLVADASDDDPTATPATGP